MHVLEKAFKWRPRIEHAQIMTLEDIERIGRLGGELFSPVPFFLLQRIVMLKSINIYAVIPSVQPTHA